MRNRLEDLGKISVMLSYLAQDEFFDRHSEVRSKDFAEWFFSQDSEEQENILRKYAYGRENIHHKIYDILSIADGTDPLNSPDML